MEHPVPADLGRVRGGRQGGATAGAWIETFSPTNGNRFAGLAWQAGASGTPPRATPGPCTSTTSPPARSPTTGSRWSGASSSRPSPTGRTPGTRTSRPAPSAWIGASWGDALLAGNAPGTKGKWRAAPLPQWQKGANAHANWGGSTTAVFAKASYPKDALDFALWLNSDPKSIALLIDGGYGFPSAKKGYATSDLDVYKDFFGGQAYSRVFADAGAHVDTSWQWGPGVDTLYQRLGDAFTEALDSGGSFRSVLRTVQAQTVSDLRGKGLKVESGG